MIPSTVSVSKYLPIGATESQVSQLEYNIQFFFLAVLLLEINYIRVSIIGM